MNKGEIWLCWEVNEPVLLNWLGSGLPPQHILQDGPDGLRKEETSGSSSGMDILAGSGSVMGGGSHTWYFAAIGSGIKVRSVVEDLSWRPGHYSLGRRVQSGAGREMAAGDGICTEELELMGHSSRLPR